MWVDGGGGKKQVEREGTAGEGRIKRVKVDGKKVKWLMGGWRAGVSG